MSAKTKYRIISVAMNAVLGILCFFGSFFSIMSVSIDVNSSTENETYKLIITAIIVIIACILIPLLFNNLLYSFFKKGLSFNKKYLRNSYIYFCVFFFISCLILMIYTFYTIANQPIELE